jgi:ubiquinone/menaquinone biosynthesis C-methylase UbiE
MNELESKLDKLRKIFALEKIVNIKSDNSYIQKYYKVNQIPYTYFHSGEYVHMAISKDGIFKKDDLLEAPRIIENNIKKYNSKTVLELATGRGSNSSYLARKFGEVKFYGIDISKGQLDYAYKKQRHNFEVRDGDYHNLSQFDSESFDIVFIIEALCYSQNKDKVLSEVYRILKPNGLFIVIDGYPTHQENYTKDELLAVKLIARGMALNDMESYENFMTKVQKNKFKVLKEENMSKYVIPNNERFEKMASKYFHYPFVAKLFNVFLPKIFVYNAISGYLFPYFFRKNLIVYMITTLQK